jgi:hypothetical protein
MTAPQIAEWITSIKHARSAEKVLTATQTTAYLGTCDSCNRPVRFDATDMLARVRPIPCPDCGRKIEGHRLAATTTTLLCDGSCMGAHGPMCDCGCGGVNHGAAWGFPLGSGLIPDSLLDKYRQHRARVEAQREQRRQARIARQKSEFETWAEEFWEFLEFLDAEKAGGADPYPNDFLYEMQLMVGRQEIPTERQLDAAARIIESRLAARQRAQERAALAAHAQPFPKERTRISGMVSRVDVRDHPDWGTYFQAHIELKEGAVVLLRLPSKIWAWVHDNRSNIIFGETATAIGPDAAWSEACRGMIITCDVRLSALHDKPWMAYGNRPTKIEFDTSALEVK